MLWTEIPAQGVREGRSAYGTSSSGEARAASFADLAVFDPVSVTLTQRRPSANRSASPGCRRTSSRCSASCPCAGAAFSAAGGRRSGSRVAVISHRFWQARFGGSADAIGASLELDGRAVADHRHPSGRFQLTGLDADVWEPHTLFPDWETRRTALGAGSWFVVGRLRPHVTLEQAQAEMSAIAAPPRRSAAGGAAGPRHQRRSVEPACDRIPPAPGAVDAHRRGVVPAAGRRRQRRRPVAGAQRRPRAGDGDSRGARCEPRADRAAAARRERDDCRRSRACSACCSPLPASRVDPRVRARRPRAPAGGQPRSARARLGGRLSPCPRACWWDSRPR